MQQIQTYINTKLIFILLCISSIPYAVLILFPLFPQPVKVLSSGVLWIAIFLILRNAFHHAKYHHSTADLLVSFLLFITLLQIIRAFMEEGHTKALTLLTNPVHAICLCTPILYYANQPIIALKYVYRFGLLLICISTFCLHSNYYILYMTPMIFPYALHRNKYQYLLYAIILSSLALLYKDAFIPNSQGDTQRALLIILGYSIIVVVASKLKKYYRTIALFTACFSIIVPIALFCYSITKEQSVFEYTNEIEDDHIKGDTRTFLYMETLIDLQTKKAFIEGIGISNGYYSPFFHERNRDVNEVTFLHYLFRGGLIWLIPYMLLIIYAIYHAIKYSRNLLCLGGSIMLSGYFFACFIMDVIALSFIHVIIWFFIATCSSKKWTSFSNSTIYQLINNTGK